MKTLVWLVSLCSAHGNFDDFTWELSRYGDTKPWKKGDWAGDQRIFANETSIDLTSRVGGLFASRCCSDGLSSSEIGLVDQMFYPSEVHESRYKKSKSKIFADYIWLHKSQMFAGWFNSRCLMVVYIPDVSWLYKSPHVGEIPIWQYTPHSLPNETQGPHPISCVVCVILGPSLENHGPFLVDHSTNRK